MSGMKNTSKKLSSLSTALVLLFFGGFYLIFNRADAADLVPRTVILSSSYASENTTHTYQFRTITPSNIGSVRFQYCSNSPLFTDPCTAPAGLNASGAGVLSETGLTGFSISGASNASNIVITRAPAFAGSTNVSFTFDNVVNPSASNSVNYVRITTYDNINATGSVVDTGAVVFVTEDPFDVTAYVPPYLTFCVGVTVAIDCSTTSGFLADFGEFSEFTPSTTTSQFSAATNDPTGYNTFINGQTMTSGANIIPNLIANTASQPGTSQFGLNLRSNTNPSVGSNPQAGPVGNGSVAPNYNNPNLFRFVSGERLAGSTKSSGFNRYTVSYIVNISADQRPGVYASTFSYTAIASF